MNKKILLSAILIIVTASFCMAEGVDATHLVEIPAMNGTAGYIQNPSGYTHKENTYSLGIHKFGFKANYGLLGFIDLGVFFDFSDSSDILKVIQLGDLNLKVKITDEENMFVTSSAGIERLPFSMGAAENWSACRIYAAASKQYGDFSFGAGIAQNLSGSIDFSSWDFLLDAGMVVNDTVLAVAEYTGRGFNAGVKISMNYNITVELMITGIDKLEQSAKEGSILRDHFVFGITYRQ